CSLFFIR
ncbi:hypothetical protein BV111_00553B, partial [Haemophilus influenzae]